MLYYYDSTKNLNPYAYCLPGDLSAGMVLPDNALAVAPEVRLGYWPVLNTARNGWDYVEDHRQTRDERGRVVEGSGTAYWMPEDTHHSPPRYMESIGPLPAGALTTRPEQPDPTLNEARSAKLAEINGAADASLSALTASYPQAELLTFDKQEAEARALKADPAADAVAAAPLLSALAAGRGIPLADLAEKVLLKADAFTQASGYVIGQRQGLEDTLDRAESVEDVRAIVVVIGLPGQQFEPQAPKATA